MARNWGTASSGGLSDLVDSYRSGVQWRQSDEDRTENKAYRRLKEDQDQARNDPYQEVVYDAQGNPTGLRERRSWQKRDEKPSSTRSPEFFREDPKPTVAAPAAAPAAKPAVADPLAETEKMNSGAQAAEQRSRDRKAMVERMKANGQLPANYQEPAGERGPQGEESAVKPLLKDPKAAQTEAQMQQDAQLQREEGVRKTVLEEKKLPSGQAAALAPGTKSVEYDLNDPGVPTSDGRTAINARKTTTEIDRPLEITAEAGGTPTAAAPAAAATEAEAEPAREYDPSPYMRKRITDMVTSAPKLAQKQMVSLATLDPALKERLGIDPNTRASIPEDVLVAWLKGEFGEDAAQIKADATAAGNAMDPIVDTMIDAVTNKRMDPGQAISAIRAATGRQPTKREVEAISRAAGQGATQGRFETRNNREDRKIYDSMVKETTRAIQKDFGASIQQLNAARNIKRLVGLGDTEGVRRAVQIMTARAAGEVGALSNTDVSGASGVENLMGRIEQIAKTIEEGGLTQENKEIFNNLADAFLEGGERSLKAKTAAHRRAFLGRVGEYGLDQQQASQFFDSALSSDALMEDLGVSESQRNQEKDLMREQQMVAGALRAIDSNPKYQSMNPSQRRAAKAKIMEAFKKKTGIDWEPKK